jgi:anti-anti-sigma factor
MANNFKVDVIQQDSIHILMKLRGDFDGDSAHQLLNLINDKSNGIRNITLNTDALKSVYSFGSDLFCAYIKSLRRHGLNIVFNGKSKSTFTADQFIE